MQTDAMTEQLASTPTTDGEMLTKVRRDLVQIHASIDERLNNDPEVMPWTLRELMGLIREIRTFQQGQPSPS